MGGWMTHLIWGGDPDAVNPVSGLSKRDIYVVQKTWAVAATDSVGTGNELLKRYFRAYPETKDFFRMIKNVPEEKFTENFQFKAHVINLMSALDLAVKNLHQPEVVAAMMAKLGESHGRRKIQEKQFNELTIVIVQLFKDVLNLDDKTLAAWGRVVEFWYKHIFETLSGGENR